MSTKSILDGLNDRQREAILHEGAPLLILAGAGSGKTRVITRKFAHLAKKHSPQSIFAVTFTNKAAREMRTRIGDITKDDLKGSWIGTFHAQCNRILRTEITPLGYGKDFTIYDDDDQQTLIRHILKEFKIYEALYKGILSRISSLKSSFVSPEQFLSDGDGFGFEERLARVYVRYQDELKRCNALDFDDLIMLTVKLFDEHPQVLEKYHRKFKHVLVDEFQDTNPSQYRLLKCLSKGSKNIDVVGDDDQSIYGFRGAAVENILTFEKDFPGTKIIKLEQNYRSTKNILFVSGELIRQNQERRQKTLWSERDGGEKVSFCWFGNEDEEAKHIAKHIKELYLKGVYNYDDFAVLYRINMQSRALEQAFRHDKIPYRVIGGVSFFRRKEIKDMAAYMRLSMNHNDNVSLRRVINTPPRGIGASTLAKIEQTAKKQGVSLFTSLKSVIKGGASLTSVTKVKLEGFIALIEELGNAKYKNAPDMLRTIYIKSGYSDIVEDERADNVKEFIESAEGKSVDELMDYLSLVSSADDAAESNAVSLLTMHSAKGLEFPAVFISGMEEGVLPYFKAKSEKEIAEERRLLYVAMTRAKDALLLSGAKKRKLYAKVQEQEPSRFLSEIPEECCCRIDKIVRDLTAEHLAKKKAKPMKTPAAYAIGTRVRHPKWGVGVVRDCYGDGDGEKITVNFPAIGVKRLSLKFANLEKIVT